MTQSCLYEGAVRHRRANPQGEFHLPLALAYVDLDELPGLLGGRLVRRGFGALRFRREDYLPDRPAGSLDEAVRSLVAQRTGHRPTGPIRVLTQLRSFGICFNPVSFMYCFEPGGERLEAIVAEVTNTPWGERHAYVISNRPRDLATDRVESEPSGAGRVIRGEFAKALHVSPFMGMDHVYCCRATAPADALSVQIDSLRDGVVAFDATLSLRRRELSRASVLRHLARYPLAPMRVLALIYTRALRLKLAGAAYFPHPRAGAA